MFAHAQVKYPRSVHFRLVAAQNLLIRSCMPRAARVAGNTDDLLVYSTGLVWRK